MGSITFGPNNGGVNFSNGTAGSVDVSGNGGGVVLSDVTTTVTGVTLTSYQRAVMAGFAGTEGDFYTGISEGAVVFPVQDLPPLP